MEWAPMNVELIQQKLREFARERDWEQFHTPKNVAIALSVEASELLEIFQWMSDQQVINVKSDIKTMEKISHEVADVMLYLLRFADVLSLDLNEIIENKIKLNEIKYPIEKSRGTAKKYTDL